ncbi:uncharacterized protein LOC107474282 [Arachis duranensis]|uniref:Uncharacterized protein LOC107474282 n=1 Tax=Arachis duranensis TaxID=130453 RepID=A0A6P4CDX7_ARADU|nr:uncharacterized protein LOC107474282 [Arachis duranensis]
MTMEKMIKHQELANKNHEASLRNLERQIGQLSKQIVAERPTSALPNDTIPNPKEECKAIQLRSGRTLENDKEANKKHVENDIGSKKRVGEKDKQDQEESKQKEEELQASKKGKQIMKEHPQEQKKKGLPPKLKDPGSFFLSCTIGSMPLDKALCDLGASINLMPLSLMMQLAIEELRTTRMSLQMADRSLKIPNGVVENLLVKVGEFIFPTDFVILDIEKEEHNSIILGRPFLATTRAIIDVEKGEMFLRVHDEQMIINVFKAIEYPPEKAQHMRVEMIEKLIEEVFEANGQEEQEEETEAVQEVSEEQGLKFPPKARQRRNQNKI